MAAGTASGFPGTAPAEGSTSGAARIETTPVAASAAAPGTAPADALVTAGSAAAATPVSQLPSSTASAPQPAAPAAPQPGATLQPQLAKPLFTLAGAPQGQHIMTLQVTPEDLGPMTVRAHIDAAGVRIELFAPGDAGREAIRGVLPELRKELADAGFGASLDVSEHTGPGNTARDGTRQDGTSQGGAGRDSGSGPGNRNGSGEQRPGHRWEALADGAALRDARILNGPQTTLDILV
ncbi:flagellar hook-length control protein FliK [Arthrobacter sp. YAF17]|uniref:flagellar hook-length control protein FliK n=1 Tax=Arthrobacter sp. YAF17 TaxID=3233077 RepID=UPI003F90EB44